MYDKKKIYHGLIFIIHLRVFSQNVQFPVRAYNLSEKVGGAYGQDGILPGWSFFAV